MRSKNIFSANQDNGSREMASLVNRLLAAQFQEKVIGIDKLSGGTNSETSKILTDRGNEYFAKKYRIRKGDDRNRLSTEFSGLSFLWGNGIRNIPEPIAACAKSRLAVYRFIKGTKIQLGEMSAADVDEAADFIGRLQLLTDAEGADAQPVASEACFSVQEYIDCVENRIAGLDKAGKKGIVFDALRSYMDDEFMPLYRTIKKMTVQKARNLGIDIAAKIQKSEMTLSQSDFGFQNAIKAENGKIFFIDFEYYGWDDPVKLIADFYLEPAVPVPLHYREHFFEKARKNYNKNTRLEKRLPIIYPLLGLKWCLIMLNVFHRIGEGEANETKCLERIDRAEEKLEAIRREIDIRSFPLSLTRV